eukprot:m.361429 g.361429  ORF g.361429 m.361429 type:complete len:51 (-) comp19583_c0_seq1:94-246(-)
MSAAQCGSDCHGATAATLMLLCRIQNPVEGEGGERLQERAKKSSCCSSAC